jgi:hypothetical protein
MIKKNKVRWDDLYERVKFKDLLGRSLKTEEMLATRDGLTRECVSYFAACGLVNVEVCFAPMDIYTLLQSLLSTYIIQWLLMPGDRPCAGERKRERGDRTHRQEDRAVDVIRRVYIDKAVGASWPIAIVISFLFLILYPFWLRFSFLYICIIYIDRYVLSSDVYFDSLVSSLGPTKRISFFTSQSSCYSPFLSVYTDSFLGIEGQRGGFILL